MEQMRIKHNENGRSMVEMLGVLAVVGVLSIGGVAGYRYAVDKMNANEIINELKKRAITASQQRVLSQDINLAEYGAILGKYEVAPANGYPEDPAFFGLEIAGVPERVCNMILESDWALPSEILIAGEIAEKGDPCDAGGNTLTFAFSNTLGSGEIGNEGNNDPTDTPTQQCGENEYLLADGTCKEDTKCTDPNQFWNTYTYPPKCTACPTEGNSVKNSTSDFEDSCTKCTNAQHGNIGTQSYCVYCPSNRTVCGDQCCGEGQQCNYNGYQYECVSSLGAGECLTNEDCEIGEYCKNEIACSQILGTCQPATLYNNGVNINVNGIAVYRSQNEMGWYAAKNFCMSHGMTLLDPRDHCSSDEWMDIQDNHSGYCQALRVSNASGWSGWTASGFGSCYVFSMHLTYGISTTSLDQYPYAALCVGEAGYVPPVVSTEATTQTETTTTTATVTMTETGTGTMTETLSRVCDEQQIQAKYGYCYDCSDTEYAISVDNESECSKCDGSGYQWTMRYITRTKTCTSCSYGVFSDYEDNVEESCRKCGWGVNWNSAFDYYGSTLYFCSSGPEDVGAKPETVSTVTGTQTETTTATQTQTETVTVSRSCGENQIQDGYGNCYDCSYSGQIGVSNASECSKCEDSGYKWLLTYYYNGPRCSPYSHCNYISDREDRIEETCELCGKGVDWNGCYDDGHCYCSPTSEDIGTKLGTVATVTETQTQTDTTTTTTATKTVTDTTTTTATQTQTETTTATQAKKQICGTNGECYDCSYGYYVNVDNASECSNCMDSGYTWTVAYYGETRAYPKCVPCHATFSDLEDHIETSCKACGKVVDWTSCGYDKMCLCS